MLDTHMNVVDHSTLYAASSSSSMIWTFWPFGVPIVIRWTPVFFSTERGVWDVKMGVALVLMGASTWLVPFQDEDSLTRWICCPDMTMS
jgi:hypothetical protein